MSCYYTWECRGYPKLVEVIAQFPVIIGISFSGTLKSMDDHSKHVLLLPTLHRGFMCCIIYGPRSETGVSVKVHRIVVS